MFSEHPKSIFWSDRNEKKSNEVALNSHKKLIWRENKIRVSIDNGCMTWPRHLRKKKNETN